jgi:O-antigen/teichoic acid export membrane protein
MPDNSNSPLPQFTEPVSSRALIKSQLTALRILFAGSSAREGYLAAIDQGLISLSNFLATLILARQVSPTELGVYGVGFITLRLVRSLQEGAFIQPMNVLGAPLDRAAFRRYASSTTLLQAGMALISALAVGLIGWFLTASGNDVAGPTIFSLWFAFIFWQMQEYIRRALYTRGSIAAAVINTGLANLVRLALMMQWVNQGSLSGVAGLNAIAWGSAVALGHGLLATRDYWTLKPDNLLKTWQRNWDFGRWMLGGLLANWVAIEFYPVLTAGLISFAAAGAYRALQNLVAPIHLLLRAIDTFLTPRAARLFSSNGLKALNHTLTLTYLVAGAPVVGMLAVALLFPAQILRLFYGETYLPYTQGIVWMTIFYTLLFVNSPLQTVFKAARLSRPIFIANLAASLSMFTLGIFAIFRWGVYGTIAGQALNSLIVGIILWSAWHRLNRPIIA